MHCRHSKTPIPSPFFVKGGNMNKKEYEMYERALRTGERLEKLYFNQTEALNKLYSYIELRKMQLQYAESKEEMEFIQSYLNDIRR